MTSMQPQHLRLFLNGKLLIDRSGEGSVTLAELGVGEDVILEQAKFWADDD